MATAGGKAGEGGRGRGGGGGGGPRPEDRSLAEYLDAPVNVITSDGRCIVGVLRGFDTTNNLVLEDCHERVFSPQSGVEQVALGLYFVRGDNVAVVGELDDDLEANLDLSALTAQPLKPIRHG